MEIKIPTVGESISEVTIAEWLKQDGDTVKADEVLLSIETEKANVEVVAEVGGVLSIGVQKGETVAVGAVVGHVQEGGASSATSAEPAVPSAVVQAAAKAAQAAGGTSVGGTSVGGTSVGGTAIGGTSVGGTSIGGAGAAVAAGSAVTPPVPPAMGPKGPTRPVTAGGPKGPTRPVVAVAAPSSAEAPVVSAPVVSANPAPEVPAAPEATAVPPDLVKPAAVATVPEAPVASTVSAATGPAARQAAGEQGVSLDTVQGTGPRGRIQKEDVLQHSTPAQPAESAPRPAPTPRAEPASMAAPTPQPEPVQQPAPKAKPAPKVTTQSVTTQSVTTQQAATQQAVAQRTSKEPMSRLRQTIARRLVESQHRTATLTTFNEVDMSQIMKLREQYRDAFKKRYDVSLGFMGFFTKAVIEALKTYPKVNAFIEGSDVVYNHFYNIGIAVGTERGLVVPVIRDSQNKSLAEVELAIRDYASKARAGKIELRDLEGGTFTISNGGVYGSLLSTPILNPPQTGILGLHKIEQRPVAVQGKVEVRPMMYVALSYDHRLIDGTESVQFLLKIKQCIEDPSRLLLEI